MRDPMERIDNFFANVFSYPYQFTEKVFRHIGEHFVLCNLLIRKPQFQAPLIQVIKSCAKHKNELAVGINAVIAIAKENTYLLEKLKETVENTPEIRENLEKLDKFFLEFGESDPDLNGLD